jgi:hypothetical protein
LILAHKFYHIRKRWENQVKVYRLDRGIVLVGKAWEIREKLKQYEREFKLVKDWVNSIPSSKL